ncbi:protein Jade-1 isoform X1 [Stigmatopora nigra]
MWNAGQAELEARTAPHLQGKRRLATVVKLELDTRDTMKRSRHPSSSDESDNGSNSTCWSQHSSQPRRGTRQKPSEVFRTDLITAMKVHDSQQLNPEDYYVLADPWRQEWEKGVQVPVSPQSIPQPAARQLADRSEEVTFVRPKKLIRTSAAQTPGYVDIRTLAEGACRYDLNEEDVAWLTAVNDEFLKLALPPLDEASAERVLEEFERRCYDNMTHATETEEGLGIEYDEDVVCDVCQSPDGEDNNEMVFCDKCNICVHQACYGIQKVPKGSWLCRICALGIVPKCQLCPKKGGAMKPTRSGTKWVHVSCALWIPEVSIGNPEKMEPITNVSHIPGNRWALNCCLCKDKTGACIQCSAKNCRVAFHVTCGLHAGLEMTTVLTRDDQVKFKSYCPKHPPGFGELERDEGEALASVAAASGERRDRAPPTPGPAPSTTTRPPRPRDPQEMRVNVRKAKLQEMEEVFYQFVDPREVGCQLKMAPETVDFLYQYWKLKRKANFNQPLLTPKKDEEDGLARREHEVLLRRLQLFTHLRQDLERVRNLTYMVTRREKIKRSLWRVQEQIFQHQLQLAEQETLGGNDPETDPRRLLSLDRLTSRGPRPRSPWRHKTKRRSEQDKGKTRERKTDEDPAPKETEPTPRTRDPFNDDLTSEREAPPLRESRAPKFHGKRLRKEAPGSEDGKKMHRAEVSPGVEQLDRSVSVRLVDIRLPDGGAERRARKPSRAGDQALPKGWGKFRIPKRTDGSESLRPLTNTPPGPQRHPRTRLRTGAENEGGETCLKRCHSHRLRGDASLARRYVLAS